MLPDLGISDIAVKNLSKKVPIITTTHRVIHEDGSVEYFQLQMEQESAGTQHFFACIGGWLLGKVQDLKYTIQDRVYG